MSKTERKATPGTISPTQEELEELENGDTDKIVIERGDRRYEFE